MKKPTARLDAWADAQRRFHLRDVHIQMARELGLNPKKFGGLANHRQEPWKLPLPECIAACYRKRFHRERPVQVAFWGRFLREYDIHIVTLIHIPVAAPA